MLKLNKKVEYGLMALLHMDGRELSSVREIADAHNIPGAVLGKVMQMLAHQDVIESTLGAHGGYRLKRPLEEINLLQVHEAIEGPVHLTCCQEGDHHCDQFSLCSIKGPMRQVQGKLLQFITDLMLSDFREDQKARCTRPMEPGAPAGVSV